MSDRIKKILVANRGEIAIRVIRACHDAGIVSVGIYSDCDRSAYHVRMADEVYHVGPSPSRESYLNQRKIIEIAKASKSDAIHPGYGFLAENDAFSKLCEDNDMIFIGPKSKTIALLGDKLAARKTALKAGLSVIPGTDIDIKDAKTALPKANKIGFPVLVKAAAGGGGKGMRIVESEEALSESVESAIREAGAAFGDGRVYLEKYLLNPRHVEMQILVDSHGNAVYLGERECSVQRRHQKVIEESPSPVVSEKLRRKMGKAAVNLAREAGYIGAGTIEFLVDRELNFYFLEVNARLQVEHPVTELVTGVDLVREQIRIAEGAPLSFKQDDIAPRGHAVECRIYAEDPHHDFMPSTGIITEYREPSGPGIRVDSGVVAGSEIPVYYDPIIAKLISWGANRREAIERTKRALTEYRISGVHTTIGFGCSVMRSARFLTGDYDTNFIDAEFPDKVFECSESDQTQKVAIAAAVYDYLNRSKISMTFKRGPERSTGWIDFHRREAVKRLSKLG
ncbi:MAG: acetyl-CoA carboxylase biotin carboxylase subunit [Candidatus Zixiibacteriota bacterium]|nr:MAG: acetyl-CoA carboxylase biotin carboxylase subunit [candidate division Zixibacteria bacterium]